MEMTGPALARQARDEGIAHAAIGADNANPNWSGRAFKFLRQYAEANPGKYTAEDVRQAAEFRGFEAPPDKRAWGGVFRRAACARLIVRAGFEVAKDPKVHCCNVSAWTTAPTRGVLQ
jgi:hypothetical protein